MIFKHTKTGIGKGMKPGSRTWDAESRVGRDRDEFSGISGIRDGTGMSFGKPGWDRDASFNFFEIEKKSGKNKNVSAELVKFLHTINF